MIINVVIDQQKGTFKLVTKFLQNVVFSTLRGAKTQEDDLAPKISYREDHHISNDRLECDEE